MVSILEVNYNEFFNLQKVNRKNYYPQDCAFTFKLKLTKDTTERKINKRS